LYRRRVAELRDQVEDALDAGDDDRAAELQTELDALIAQLAQAVGLGGRERKASNAAEKARLNVTAPCGRPSPRFRRRFPGPAPCSTGGEDGGCSARTSPTRTTKFSGVFSPD